MNIYINHPSRFGKKMQFYWILILCMVLAGCQNKTQKETSQPATTSPVSTQALPATATSNITATLVTPVQEPKTTLPITELVPPSPKITTPTPVPTPFDGNGFLLYGATINDEEQIFALQPGGKSHFITTGEMIIGQAISPDGMKFVVDTNDFSERPKLSEKVFIFDLETNEMLPLNLMMYPRSKMFWSDDSSSLLYIARYDGEAPDQLIVYDILTGENQVLIEMEGILLTAGWSVDGQTIAYVANFDGQYDLFTIDSKTLEQTQLTDDLEIETMVLWSPTNTQLLIGNVLDERSAFESWPFGVEHLYLFDLISHNRQLLIDKWMISESVAWSPDDKQIAVWSEGLLCIKTLETMTEVCPLTDISPFDEYIVSFDTKPVWSTDGNWIAFYGINLPCMMIYFLELETNSIVPGDLDCDITEISTSFPIYWSPAKLFNFSN